MNIDLEQLRAKRLARVKAMMRERDYAACLLFDPNNQRYATDSRNMFGYFLRNSSRYIYVPAEGPIILFEYPQSFHVSTWLETIDEARPSRIVWSSVRGDDADTAGPFADEIADLVRQHTSGCRRVGLDRCYHGLALSLEKAGLQAIDCNQDLLQARAVKLEEEIACLRLSAANSEAAVHAVEKQIQPGMSEQDLFAIMYWAVIAGGGEMIETRLLSSGPRTNPWFNEAGTRRVQAGELLALDTDTIGNMGYYCDFSRTFVCGSDRASDEQRMLYRMAYDQVHHNIDQLRPGRTFREVAEAAWHIPSQFHEQRYTSLMHGCGMHGEAPFIAHASDFDTYGVKGVLEPGMVLCVESYIGARGGAQGVKLEEEVLITQDGAAPITNYPYDRRLLGREF